MADAQNSAGVTESATTPSAEQNPNPVISFLLNLLNNFKFNLPPLPFLPPPKHQFIDESSSATAPLVPEAASGGPYEKDSSPDSVSYPRQNFAPLKLEADDVEARETKPGTIWMATRLEVTWLRRGHGRGGMNGGQGGIHPMTGLPQTPNKR